MVTVPMMMDAVDGFVATTLNRVRSSLAPQRAAVVAMVRTA